ncbi:MAG TPA: ABC transporter ATP-binding protein [Thermomicrobiales bacterium]|nr:ABC transporter ATP-binding protein [Thermomicrobiales bacterium]
MENRFVIATEDLTKRYGEHILAVDKLTMRVRRGEVYGFLGPNGAGKTTTLRMLVGLIRPTSGQINVLGSPPGEAAGLAQIGSMIEAPAMYPFLSGRDNLKVVARYADVSETRIPAVLEEVDLTKRAGDRFDSYSMGMKQRLGVAAALLKDPDLLILDEPTNGLDPAGMAEMRTLIRGLGQGRRTVLLSSHLMGEIEHVCDRVGVIRHGKLVAEGTVAELRGRDSLRIRAEPLAAAHKVVSALPGVEKVTIAGDALRITTNPEDAASINRALLGAGIEVSELVSERSSLEDVFLELTQDQEEVAA